MALVQVELGAKYYADPTKGRALFNSEIFVGLPDEDPEIIGNQKQITLQQEDGILVQVSQPVLTGAGGVPLYNGSPVTILVDGNYSLKVLNAQGSQSYYVPSVPGGVTPIFVTEFEVQTLSDAQVSVTWLADITTASFYITGDSADNGRLSLDIDFTLDTITGIMTLAESYPDGTTITAAILDSEDNDPLVISVNGKDGVVVLDKTDIGLGNVDNTSDLTKFTDTDLTGTPTAPTAAPGTSTTQLATTEFVDAGGAVVTSSGSNANGFFRIWSDGYIECWDVTPVSGSDQTITLPVSLSTTVGSMPVITADNKTEVGATVPNVNEIFLNSTGVRIFNWSVRGC